MLNEAFSRPLIRALILQTLCVFFFSLMLDFGVTLRACWYSSIPFWIGAIVILIRRPHTPTRGDLAYLRWGLLFFIPLGVLAFLCVWQWKKAL
jgi:hypothetical protein